MPERRKPERFVPRVLTQFTASQLREYQELYQQIVKDTRESSPSPSLETVDQSLKRLVPDAKKLERFTLAMDVLNRLKSKNQDLNEVKEVIIVSAPNDHFRMIAKLLPVRPFVRP